MSVGWALILAIVAGTATFLLVPELLPEEFLSWRLKLPLPIATAVFAHAAQSWLSANFARHPMPTILIEAVVIIIVFLPMMLMRSEI